MSTYSTTYPTYPTFNPTTFNQTFPTLPPNLPPPLPTTLPPLSMPPTIPMFPSNTTIAASALSSFPQTLPTVPTTLSVNYNSNLSPLYPSVITYPDLNSDKQLRNKVTDYFYNKIANNWLKYQYIDLYRLLEVSGNNVSFIKNINNLSSADKDVNAKYDFILRNFLSRDVVTKLLNKYRKDYFINWWDLKDHSDKVRKYIEHKLEKYMKKQIKST